MFINSGIPSKNSVSFGESQVNICAFSDLHGNINELVPMYACIENQADDIFVKKDRKSTKNIMTIVGDYFFNPNIKGFISDKEKTAGDYQLTILQAFLDNVKKIIPKANPFFVIGNHDLDAGDNFLFNLLKKADMQYIITNFDFDSKQTDKKLNNKLIKSKIITVQDDKNPKAENKVLVLGLMLPSLGYYFPKVNGNSSLTDNFNVLDRFEHDESKTKEEELKETYKVLNEEISKFKLNNPDAPVIILAHTGEKIAKFVADNVPVDFILSGHDHFDSNEKYITKSGNKTEIISLSKDGELLKSLQLHFSDEGKLDNSVVKTFKPHQSPELKNNPVKQVLEKELAKDLNLTLKTIPAGAMLSKDKVTIDDSPLANAITDTIFREIKKKDTEIVALGVTSSSFRRSLSDGSNNADMLTALSGSIESQSLVQSGVVDGKILAEFILEYTRNNINAKKKRTVRWAGIKVNRTKLTEMIKNENSSINILETRGSDVAKCIEIMNQQGEYEFVNLTKTYKIALQNKFFIRSTIDSIKKYKARFKNVYPEDITLTNLFIKSLQENNYTLDVSDDVRIF